MRHVPRVIFALLLALAAAWWLWGELLALPDPAPARATERQRQFGFRGSPAMMAKLERPLPTPFQLDGPLDRVLKDLGKTVDVEVDTKWSQVRNAGISKNAPVRLDVSGWRFGDALLKTLEHVGGGALACRATEEGIDVSTVADLTDPRMAVYDLRDLGVRPEELVERIRTSVAPESWQGRTARSTARWQLGDVSARGGQLFVTQTEANQREVDHLIHGLRKAKRVRTFALRTAMLTTATVGLVLLAPAAYRRYRVLREPWQCDHCGYDLRASTGRCPECGRPISAPTAAASTVAHQ
jgi:hypothetical protein